MMLSMRIARVLFFTAIAAAYAGNGRAVAQVTRVEILRREAPALGSKSFGDAGQYEKIEGRVHGQVDPRNPRNKIITDLDLAPRNSAGNVEYAADFVLLKPMDMSRSRGMLRYVAPNRGGAVVAADPYFLAQGEVFLWGAWQGDVPRRPGRLALDVPVARNGDGSAITGTVRVELVGQRGTTLAEMPLQGNAYNRDQAAYPPVSLDDRTAILTRRRNEGDPRIFIPRNDWAFAASNASDNPFPGTPDPAMISLKGGFLPKTLYELIYTAKDPKVMGIGLCGVPRYGLLFPPRRRGRFRQPEPARAPYQVRDRHRRLAVRQLLEDLRAPGIQRGYQRKARLRWPVPDSRGEADPLERALRGARRWRRLTRRARGLRPEFDPGICGGFSR